MWPAQKLGPSALNSHYKMNLSPIIYPNDLEEYFGHAQACCAH